MSSESGPRWTDAPEGEALEQLIARFVDGELSGPERERAEALLASSETAQAVEARLRAEAAALSGLLGAAADNLAERAPLDVAATAQSLQLEGPARLPRRAAIGRREARRAVLASALSAVAGLAVGVFVSRPPRPAAPSTPGWRMSAAIYQRLYSEETFESAPVTREALTAGLDRVANALDVDFAELPAVDGLSLRRAQLLRFNGAPLGQIAYLSAEGAAVSLCVFRRGAPGDPSAALTSERLLDMNGVFWRSRRHAFLLVGGAPDGRMRAYAARFAAALA